jgi:hypothetical protein
MMVPRAWPTVAPPPVLRPDWETLARLASMRRKHLDLDTCSTPTSLRWFCGATDKPKPTWFWGPNQETITVILRPKSSNRSCQFWDPNWETLHHLGFEAQPRNPSPVLRPTGRNRPSGFEVKPLTNRWSWFWGSTKKPTTGFEVKPGETILVVLRPNDW